MPDILAIVSKAVFEQDAWVNRRPVVTGDVWPIDRYVSTRKVFNSLSEGGRIFLVTVRPPDEQLWFVGALERPAFDGAAWVALMPNGRPVTNITALRKTIAFESGTGLSQAEGTLGMSLQTPRVLTPASAAEILAVVGGAAPLASAPGIAAPAREIEETPAAREERRGREAALAIEVDRFVVLFDRMQETYGLRLPESLAYVAGFVMGLTAPERAELEEHAGRFIGVGAWFGGSPHGTPTGGDERLRDRVATDPPEFVPVFEGGPGHERWGLWYDDSDELPTGIARRVRVGGPPGLETYLLQTPMLTALRERIARATGLHQAAMASWLDIVLRHEAAKVLERCPIRPQRDGAILGERMNPHVLEWALPLDLMGESAQRARSRAYTEEAPIVDEWIERARAELHDGAPGRALFLGRELHAFQSPRWRLACTELLIRAYSALGRRPLADIVRAAYRHAAPDLPIYELPPAHPLSAAAASGDVDAIVLALEDNSPPSPDDLEEALASTETMKALDALLDHDASRTDTALWRRLQRMFGARKAKDVARHRTFAMRLIERGTVNARAFERILRSDDAELMAAAAARVDIGSLVGGATPLHLAASVAAPSAVRVLLERGADARVKNAEGRMAYDAAREAQIERPTDPGTSEVLTMLQKAGGGIAKPPRPASDEVEYSEGDAVHHRKLGAGIVESVAGEGEEAKLKIRFETETRTLLAKFVMPGEGHSP